MNGDIHCHARVVRLKPFTQHGVFGDMTGAVLGMVLSEDLNDVSVSHDV